MSTSPDDASDTASTVAGGSRSLLDVLRVGIVMLDPRGQIILWSPTSEDILGWQGSEAIGSHLRELLDEGRPDPSTGIYRTLLREGNWRGRLPLRHKDGRRVELEARASLLRDSEGTPFILANLVEISMLRGIEQDLAALDALFTASPLGIAIFDTERRFIRVNDALSRLHGSAPEDLLGRTVLDALPPPVSQEIHELESEVLRSGRSVIDLVTDSPDGLGAWSLSFGRLTDRMGRTLGVSCTVMDVTERRVALGKIERAQERLTLLNDVGTALGNLLDVNRIAESLAQMLVPRFADYAVVGLLRPVADGDELPPPAALPTTPLVRIGVAAKQRTAAAEAMMGGGQDVTIDPGTVVGTALTSGEPSLLVTREEILAAAPDVPSAEAARALDIHSLINAPLRARGTVLGLLTLARAGQRAPYDREDTALARELAGRAAVFMDNARLYAREREAALMLQRSLLPRSVPQPPGVSVGYRYVPSGSGAEAGGDWFDVIPLAGGRVAFVVGDVTGHGLRAAATMGRLRTAVRTLTGLDLPPAELLRRLNELSEDIAQHPDDPLMATLLYAVYDPATHGCTIARAGHLPPVLVSQDPVTGLWAARLVELPAGTPLGIEGTGFDETRVDVPQDAVLVLYTDGLIERRDATLDEGMERLCDLLTRTARPGTPLESLCDELISGLPPRDSDAGPDDDIALVVARLGGLPEGSVAFWTFPAEPHAVPAARRAVRRTLAGWGLATATDAAELLVSELVTNAVRHAAGPVGVRMVRGTSLLVEVTDPVPDPPRERDPGPEDEGGRGLPLVGQESRRWGTRQGPAGKTVWFELPLGAGQEPP